MSNRDIKLEFDTNETYTVQELARKNGLSPRPCLTTLYELDSSDDYDLTWSTDEEGIDKVIINERDVEPKDDNQKFLADANGTLAQEAEVVANSPKHERAETRKGKRMALDRCPLCSDCNHPLYYRFTQSCPESTTDRTGHPKSSVSVIDPALKGEAAVKVMPKRLWNAEADGSLQRRYLLSCQVNDRPYLS